MHFDRPFQHAPLHSAGIMPVHQSKILLGKEKRGWSAFGGKCEEGETPSVTAVREFREETAGVFENVMLDMTTSAVVKTVTPKGNPFYLYLIEFPYADGEVNREFQKKRNSTKNQREKEKQKLEWFEISDVKNLRLSTSFAADWQIVKSEIERKKKGEWTKDEETVPSN